MTISNTTRSVEYTGNGSTTAWPFAFLADAGSLVVQVYDTETETLSTIGSGLYGVSYTTTGFSAGTVTYPLTGSPLASTKKIIISRTLTAVQTLALGNQSTFYPALFEAALDRIVMLLQQVSDRANRSLAVRVGESAIAELAVSAEGRAERALMFDATGLVLIAGPSAGEVEGAEAAALSAGTSAVNALMSELAAAATLVAMEELLNEGAASGIAFTPAGGIAATNVQAALEELDTEKQPKDDELTALAGLTSAANKIPMFSGSGTATLIDRLDEDDFASDSATSVPTQQSAKAYVDNRQRRFVASETATSGTNGPNSATATWNARPLNLVDTAMTGASLAAGVVTLPAGVYDVSAMATAYAVGNHRLRLYNVTAGAVLIEGLNALAPGATWETAALLEGRITLASTTDVRLDHYTQAAATAGLGVPASTGTAEIYARLLLNWVGAA